MRRLIFFLTMLLVLSACNSTSEVLRKEKPNDFAFSLKYGVRALNELNTYDNTYTKDLVEDGTETTDMVLSNEEIEVIYEKFRSADVLSLPEEKGGPPCTAPYYRYELSMTVDGEEYYLKWDTSCESKALNRWERTMNFINREIIYPKDEYQSLPEPTGGYE
ncbi:membrane lipoprotein lipid attachment site-containing protein [Sporosarcina sp. ACRSL]|uniref:membrane lipoprotein lipid attachment site-containing protein n=1 Tax=Sporosarcina sp. ACRSL TaxID=2918215 RepID=UPI001EF4BF31|nr:membrane lipoprotein lipid attachment site-containing protein [Sporosarcina sp. ACRSL]MCG7343421.1 membrane lipoprotein lipid attachment site-containing protein [Sporosarcina sp. ACRSL]